MIAPVVYGNLVCATLILSPAKIKPVIYTTENQMNFQSYVPEPLGFLP